MPINFVSVSAISDVEQLAGIARIYQEERFSFPLAIGYQVSNKSINQGTQNARQPKFSDLGILDKHTRDYGFSTAVHYYTKDNSTIVGDLERIAGLVIDPVTTLLQFNTLPLSLKTLGKVRKMGFNVIFKVAVSDKQTPQGGYAVWKGEGVQDVASGQVELLINQVLDRRDFIDYAMFDPSHGTNLDLNLDETSLAIRFGRGVATHPNLKEVGLVYAGGVKPSNVRQLTKVLNSHFPSRFSIDTESGVRTNDALDLELVRSYLMRYWEEIPR